MLYSSLHADMHICTLMHHLKFYRLFFVVFFEDLQTFGMDPCMIQILVFSIKFNMFEMSTICRHENTTGVMFITHFVSRQRGISFNKIVNNIFFYRKDIYNVHHTVLAVVKHEFSFLMTGHQRRGITILIKKKFLN